MNKIKKPIKYNIVKPSSCCGLLDTNKLSTILKNKNLLKIEECFENLI